MTRKRLQADLALEAFWTAATGREEVPATRPTTTRDCDIWDEMTDLRRLFEGLTEAQLLRLEGAFDRCNANKVGRGR